jgi:putative peptidoglycan lipid II flippase
VSPLLLNVATIGCAVGLAGSLPALGLDPIFALAVGTLVGGVAQLVIQLPPLWKLKLLVRPAIDFANTGLRKVLRITLPMVFGVAAYQIGLFVSNNFASQLGPGAVTYIQFSARLMEFPLAVLVMAISTAALPSLAALRGQGEMEEMKGVYMHALRLGLFVTTPAMIALIVLAEPIMTVLYQRGLFNHDDVAQTAAALQWMAAGICSIALLRQTAPVFYALERVRAPVVMSFAYVAAYVASAIPLMRLYGHVGLCMALSIAATVQGVGLLIALRVKIGRLGLAGMIKAWLKMLVATVPMGAAIWAVAALGRWERGGNDPRNVAVLAGAVLAGIAVYVAAARLFRLTELTELAAAVRRRRRR